MSITLQQLIDKLGLESLTDQAQTSRPAGNVRFFRLNDRSWEKRTFRLSGWQGKV
jgi:hypothetical protein